MDYIGHTDYVYVLEILTNGNLASGSNDETIPIPTITIPYVFRVFL